MRSGSSYSRNATLTVLALSLLLLLHAAAPRQAFAQLSYGEIVVRSDPPGATLTVDGEEMRDAHGTPEVTPWGPAQLPEGPHIVVLQHPRFPDRPKQVEVIVRGDLTSIVGVRWTPESAGVAPAPAPQAPNTLSPSAPSATPSPARALATLHGNLQVASTPVGAMVYLNGSSRGKTPVEVQGLPAGEYQLRLELSGLPALVTNVSVVAGRTIPTHFALKGRPLPPPPPWRAAFFVLTTVSVVLAGLLVAVRKRRRRPSKPGWSTTGTFVLGNYEVDGAAPIGTGGMSTVYRARRIDDQVNHQPIVALKIPHERYQADDAFIRAFREEGKLGHSLHNNNIVKVYGVDTTPQGVTYLAMEFIEGTDLGELISRGLSVGESVNIAIQIGRALDYAHTKGVVHCDIKPGNVLVSMQGMQASRRAVLTDFGIAQAMHQTNPSGDLITGTPGYMAPEIIRRRAPSAVSDLYAFGVVLYEMLTGRNPFTEDDGDPHATMERQMALAPTPPDEVNAVVPHQLAAIVMELLEKRPERRYPSAEAFINALERFEQAPASQT